MVQGLRWQALLRTMTEGMSSAPVCAGALVQVMREGECSSGDRE